MLGQYTVCTLSMSKDQLIQLAFCSIRKHTVLSVNELSINIEVMTNTFRQPK